jgi:glycosyltransferase involved in cell wall biosynthesis
MNKPRVLISHPTGNQNVRNAVASLAEREMLAEFWTTVAWDAESGWNRLLPAGLRSLLERRAYREAQRERVRSVPWREMVRLGLGAGSKLLNGPLNGLLTSGERSFSIIGVYRHFDSKVARRLSSLRPDAVYCYEGGALKTFREARRLGIRTIYEQASSYWHWVRSLLAQEAERSPAYAELLPNLADSTEHLQWKDEELSLADTIFVASEHVRCTLAGAVPEEKIRVVPYGAAAIRRREPIATDPARPLRVLFVGVLVQHKGIGYLLDAIDRLGTLVELTLVGRRFKAHPRVDEACRRWRWFETLSHGQVLDVMMASDVLVLPSLGEGFGLVVTEALACGLPVIVTPNVGASDLIEDGREGFVVPVCSADAIAERLQNLDRDRNLLAAMSRHAQATAAENSWKNYRANFADTVEAVVACR